MVGPVEAVVAIPETLSDPEAAPVLCAGVTTFDALRRSGAFPGDLVAVEGIGGLGPLGVQFANKFGYKVAGIPGGGRNPGRAKKTPGGRVTPTQHHNTTESLFKIAWAP